MQEGGRLKVLNMPYLPCSREFSQPLSVTPRGVRSTTWFFSVQTRAVRRAPTRFCRARDSFLILVIFGPYCVAYLLLCFCPARERAPEVVILCESENLARTVVLPYILFFGTHSCPLQWTCFISHSLEPRRRHETRFISSSEKRSPQRWNVGKWPRPKRSK